MFRAGLSAARYAGRFAGRAGVARNGRFGVRRIAGNGGIVMGGTRLAGMSGSRGFGLLSGQYGRVPVFAQNARRMTSAARTGRAAAGGVGVASRTRAGLAAAAAAASGAGAARNLTRNNKTKKKGDTKGRPGAAAQRLRGAKGDDLTTKDSNIVSSGSYPKNLQMISGKNIIKNSGLGGIRGSQGRATWTEIDSWLIAEEIKDVFKTTTIKYGVNPTSTSLAPEWRRGYTLNNTVGYFDNKFLYESIENKYEFKNQSSSPTTFEYFIIQPKDTAETVRNWKDDFEQGYVEKAAGTVSTFDLVAAGTPGVNELPILEFLKTPEEYRLGASHTFNRYWKIAYSHKVVLCEGQMHEFTYKWNMNKIISVATLPESNAGVIKHMSSFLIVKVNGEIGDNSNLINAILKVSTPPSKIIWKKNRVTTVRHAMLSPNVVIDDSVLLRTDLANIYDKDPNTGDLEDVNVET